ncbi:DUF4124 domain-containing protein [Janthinobacterium fluminis]|uniref:DUF4124 domain-containing protein n=1 Tax=Janthinobacterium fluminis TaxID=2987524 RepID=A0ABT5JXE3_9BURK|nr:DUF4124 domain-containing protein [Janthinobacterium fluminis]MDC8757244.1 DUF4124 domain-containing protein [Janthinobacterium fluminis]
MHKIAALAAALALGAGAHARADGQIFLCVDANGHKELTDQNRKGNCKLLDLPGAIAAPPKRAAPAPAAAAPRAAAPAPVTPADFPKVESGEQRARDNDRRQILLDELKAEEHKLAALRLEYKGGEPERNGNERNYAKYQERVAQMKDNIGRAEKNVEALKREIANIR